jgi:adenylate cyclase class 1
VADEYFIVQFIQQQPYILRFPSYAKLLEKLAQPQQEFSPIVVDNYALLDKPLKLFCNFVRASGIYLFYQVEATIIHLSLVDEHGAIFSKSLPLYSVTTVLRPLCRFVRRILERQRLANHVLLDRKTMLANIEDIKIFEVMGDASLKNAYLEIRSVGQDISQVKFIDICAMAEPNEFDELTFTLRCNDKEFSELEYGEQLYNVLATFIVSCRARGETYPCYITDVDLSQCRELIAPQSGLQLIHYLRIKNDIEVKLNAALTSL